MVRRGSDRSLEAVALARLGEEVAARPVPAAVFGVGGGHHTARGVEDPELGELRVARYQLAEIGGDLAFLIVDQRVLHDAQLTPGGEVGLRRLEEALEIVDGFAGAEREVVRHHALHGVARRHEGGDRQDDDGQQADDAEETDGLRSNSQAHGRRFRGVSGLEPIDGDQRPVADRLIGHVVAAAGRRHRSRSLVAAAEPGLEPWEIELAQAKGREIVGGRLRNPPSSRWRPACGCRKSRGRRRPPRRYTCCRRPGPC